LPPNILYKITVALTFEKFDRAIVEDVASALGLLSARVRVVGVRVVGVRNGSVIVDLQLNPNLHSSGM